MKRALATIDGVKQALAGKGVDDVYYSFVKTTKKIENAEDAE